MIQNRNMTAAAKRKQVVAFFDLSGTDPIDEFIFDPVNDIKLERVDLVYTVATSADAQGEGFRIGKAGDLAYYMAAMNPAVSKAIGTVTPGTLLKDIVPAGTACYITRTAESGTANTGECILVVQYYPIDNASY